MGIADKNIFGSRLKLARKMAAMSLQELSDALENKVTKQALNKYELGLMGPTSEVLMAVSKALKIKPDYFLKEIKTELGEIKFRKRVSLSKKIEDSIVEKARDYVEKFIEIENLLGISHAFYNPIADFIVASKNDAEEAANRLRREWQLGVNPIPNIIEMLELKGIKIFLIEETDEIDGFATITTAGIPLVVINTKDRLLERIRFTIIHELAHVLLKFTDEILTNEKEEEILCHFFSSCFLIPSQMLLHMLGSRKREYIAINELITVKEYYGISIRALLHRLRELGIITPNYYQRWMVYMGKTYGSKKEKGNYKGEEKSRIFQQLVNRAFSEGLISISKAAILLDVSPNELRKEFMSVK